MSPNTLKSMAATVDELKKLSPDERIKRLKELEEERKREIEEAETLIRETNRELAEAEEKQKIPIPEARATDLSTLTTSEERQIVTTHHFLASGAETQQPATAAPQPQKQKNLEQVAEEENVRTQQLPQQHDLLQKGQSKFQKPEYALGTAKQGSAMADYLSGSQQTVTGGGRGGPAGSPIEDKITDFYKDNAVTGAESEDQKYFGTQAQVSGSYEMHKAENEKKSMYEKRRTGPA